MAVMASTCSVRSLPSMPATAAISTVPLRLSGALTSQPGVSRRPFVLSLPAGFAAAKGRKGLTQSVRRSTAAGERRRRGQVQCSSGWGQQPSQELQPELKEALDGFVKGNKVILFMKGTRDFPQCGFSNTCVQILNTMSVPYQTVNILENEMLRQGLKIYSAWPTFPQLYVDGEFVGGCDITIEMYQSGELKELVERALVS